ncbi:hypothetical protein AXF15_10295 [Desulfomicrobium orale DSM 12838]|uniref:Uncharacterized protein n=1 Tax=Desulfomicrobium orale DSM 12838 TaxID=888061 RepID=A0A0X8JS04_9BACT|nr:hypothetical protein AXF15_10295 [Desulfomicrobium orale DSM 12838]
MDVFSIFRPGRQHGSKPESACPMKRRSHDLKVTRHETKKPQNESGRGKKFHTSAFFGHAL